MNPFTAKRAGNIFSAFFILLLCILHALLLFLNNFSVSKFTFEILSLLALMGLSQFILTINFALNCSSVVLHLYLLGLFS